MLCLLYGVRKVRIKKNSHNQPRLTRLGLTPTAARNRHTSANRYKRTSKVNTIVTSYAINC
jgi:hypothetical protein